MLYDSFVISAIQSAQNYYDYVDSRNCARSTIFTHSIVRVKKNIYTLELSKPLNNDGDLRMCLQTATPDTSIFCDTEKRYVNGELFSVTESSSNGTITLKVLDELDCILQETNCRDISFVSDMKFLIENVKKWYINLKDSNRIKNGYPYCILFPPYPQVNSNEYYFKSLESDVQIEAIINALSNNISYIWGPPGTGKTKIVLSDCVLSYIRKRKCVFIIAPTNNAVENMLRAIIPSLQDEGESIDCLYRMGMSTKAFAQEYGQICETRDATAVIKKLQQDMTALQEQRRENIIAIKTIADCKKYKFAKNTYDENIKTKGEYSQRLEIFRFERSQSNIQLESFKKTLVEITKQKETLERKEKSLSFRIQSFFNKRKILLLEEEKRQVNEKHLICNAQIIELNNKIYSLNFSIENCENVINKADFSMKSSLKNAEEAAISVIGYFTNFEDITEKLDLKYQNAVDVQIDEDIENKIKELDTQIAETKALFDKDTEEKYVYAFTVDYLISHYQSLYDLCIKKRLAHVFLDEAAYCPFIKSAPLFSFNVPVTFFGDHMQLPPICEASDNALSSHDEKLFLWDMSALYFPQLFETDYSLEDIFTTYENKTPPQSTVMSISVLSKTFRFGDNLAKILDKFVYKTGFCGQTAFNTTITAIHAKKLGNEERNRVNLGEVKAIKEYIFNNTLDDFAILTPYVNQKEQLIKHLRGIVNYENISTIHASQGKEWETVIISVSDTGNMYFTNSLTVDGLYTLNTAISRAKRNIVLVCDCDFWSKHGERQLIGKLVNNATQKINFLPYK